jgi:hypothetical protein
MYIKKRDNDNCTGRSASFSAHGLVTGAVDRRTAIHEIYERPARNTVDLLPYHKCKIACVQAMKGYK